MERIDVRHRADSLGSHFRAGLDALQTKHPLIGEVRGMGLMQGIELVKDRKTKEPAPEATARLFEATRERGLLIGKGGLYNNVIRISPPMIVEKNEIDHALEVLDQSFATISA